MAAVQETDDFAKAPVTPVPTPELVEGTGSPQDRETMYRPTPSVANAVTACFHKAYGPLIAGVLCCDLADPSCYEETIWSLLARIVRLESEDEDTERQSDTRQAMFCGVSHQYRRF